MLYRANISLHLKFQYNRGGKKRKTSSVSSVVCHAAKGIKPNHIAAQISQQPEMNV